MTTRSSAKLLALLNSPAVRGHAMVAGSMNIVRGYPDGHGALDSAAGDSVAEDVVSDDLGGGSAFQLG